VYFHLIERAGPAFVSQLNYLIPVLAVALGALLYGERPTSSDYLATVIILAGIALSQRGMEKPARRRRQAVAGLVAREAGES
ncbi:MAG: DMT family transporter, partial [Sedimenticolaceae bacterium]